MPKASRGKQLLSQMEFIPTQISTITFISTRLQKIITQLKTKVSHQSHFYTINSTYRVLISFDDSNNYQLDLRGTDFEDLIGFEKKLVKRTEYGTKLPNITNSIDVLNVNTSAIKDNIVNGINTNTIAVIPTDGLTRSFPFIFEPRRPLFCPVSSYNIAEMRIYVTDSLGRPINFTGIDWFMTFILHSM